MIRNPQRPSRAASAARTSPHGVPATCQPAGSPGRVVNPRAMSRRRPSPSPSPSPHPRPRPSRSRSRSRRSSPRLGPNPSKADRPRHTIAPRPSSAIIASAKMASGTTKRAVRFAAAARNTRVQAMIMAPDRSPSPSRSPSSGGNIRRALIASHAATSTAAVRSGLTIEPAKPTIGPATTSAAAAGATDGGSVRDATHHARAARTSTRAIETRRSRTSTWAMSPSGTTASAAACGT